MVFRAYADYLCYKDFADKDFAEWKVLNNLIDRLDLVECINRGHEDIIPIEYPPIKTTLLTVKDEMEQSITGMEKHAKTKDAYFYLEKLKQLILEYFHHLRGYDFYSKEFLSFYRAFFECMIDVHMLLLFNFYGDNRVLYQLLHYSMVISILDSIYFKIFKKYNLKSYNNYFYLSSQWLK